MESSVHWEAWMTGRWQYLLLCPTSPSCQSCPSTMKRGGWALMNYLLSVCQMPHKSHCIYSNIKAWPTLQANELDVEGIEDFIYHLWGKCHSVKENLNFNLSNLKAGTFPMSNFRVVCRHTQEQTHTRSYRTKDSYPIGNYYSVLSILMGKI